MAVGSISEAAPLMSLMELTVKKERVRGTKCSAFLSPHRGLSVLIQESAPTSSAGSWSQGHRLLWDFPEFPILVGKREAAGLRKGHQMWTQDCPEAYWGFRAWVWDQEV